MPKEYSPEEKLLNLIKKKKYRPSGAEEQTGAQKAETPKPKETVTASASPGSGSANIARLETIKVLNAVLFFALIAIVSYFLIDIFIITPPQVPVVVKEEAVRPPAGAPEPEVKPYTYYTKDFSSKDIFESPARGGSAGPKTGVPVEELMASLSLLGVVSGDNPQAIIEDKKQMKTFFLREGQSGGGIEVKSIMDGTVTVIYRGEEITLSM